MEIKLILMDALFHSQWNSVNEHHEIHDVLNSVFDGETKEEKEILLKGSLLNVINVLNERDTFDQTDFKFKSDLFKSTKSDLDLFSKVFMRLATCIVVYVSYNLEEIIESIQESTNDKRSDIIDSITESMLSLIKMEDDDEFDPSLIRILFSTELEMGDIKIINKSIKKIRQYREMSSYDDIVIIDWILRAGFTLITLDGNTAPIKKITDKYKETGDIIDLVESYHKVIKKQIKKTNRSSLIWQMIDNSFTAEDIIASDPQRIHNVKNFKSILFFAKIAILLAILTGVGNESIMLINTFKESKNK